MAVMEEDIRQCVATKLSRKTGHTTPTCMFEDRVIVVITCLYSLGLACRRYGSTEALHQSPNTVGGSKPLAGDGVLLFCFVILLNPDNGNFTGRDYVSITDHELWERGSLLPAL